MLETVLLEASAGTGVVSLRQYCWEQVQEQA